MCVCVFVCCGACIVCIYPQAYKYILFPSGCGLPTPSVLSVPSGCGLPTPSVLMCMRLGVIIAREYLCKPGL